MLHWPLSDLGLRDPRYDCRASNWTEAWCCLHDRSWSSLSKSGGVSLYVCSRKRHKHCLEWALGANGGFKANAKLGSCQIMIQHSPRPFTLFSVLYVPDWRTSHDGLIGGPWYTQQAITMVNIRCEWCSVSSDVTKANLAQWKLNEPTWVSTSIANVRVNCKASNILHWKIR